jgi:HEAT repeat protein
MRVLKRVMSALTHFEQSVAPLMREQLARTGLPWYYLRNLILLAGDLKDAEAVPYIGKHLLHEHQHVSKTALSTLTKLGAQQANQILAGVLPRLDASSQRLLFVYFGNMRSDAALDFMLAKLDPALPDRDEALAIDLIVALGRIGRPEAVRVLKKIIRPGWLGGLFAGKVNEKVLAASIKALSEIGGDQAKDLIGKFTHHGNPEIARAAEEALLTVKKD